MNGTPPIEDENNDNHEPSISQWIASAIADTGCTVVYGGHGGALVPLVNAVVEHPALTWVCARNEHDAATMAAAHAQQTGELGVVIATSGPGATNLLTGLLEATMDHQSLLAITGQKPTAVLGYSEFQDVNQSRIFAGAGLEWSKDAASAHAVIPLLRDAVATALSRRTCVHLALPVDIQAAPSPLPLKHFCASHADLRLKPPVMDNQAMDAAAAMLVGTADDEKRPRNIIAVGVRAVYDPAAGAAIMELAEALNAPVLCRLHAKGVVDELHPLSFGVIGVHGKPGLENAAFLVSSSDTVVAIGIEDSTLLLCDSAGLQIRTLIEIQPDALAVGTRFNAEETLLGKISTICHSLASRVEAVMAKVDKKRAIARAMHGAPSPPKHHRKVSSGFSYMAYKSPKVNPNVKRGSLASVDDSLDFILEQVGEDEMERKTDALWNAMHQGDWRRLARFSNEHRRFECNPVEGSEPHSCHPSAALYALSELRRDSSTDSVSRSAVMAVDVGDVTLWASLCLYLQQGSRTLYSEHLGTMGYALNAAIASILSRPKPSGAVVLAGDGGFQMSLQELATFQQMKRPGDKLLCVVFDNEILGRVAFGFDDAAGCELGGPDYVALARAYGGEGLRLDDSSKAKEVMEQALAADGLFLVHCIVDPSIRADMATFNDNALKVMNSG